MEILLANKIGVRKDSTPFLYRVDWAQGYSIICPLRVMRQLGVIQNIILWTMMGSSEDAFTSVSLDRIRNLQVQWDYAIDLEIGEESWWMP